MNGCPSRPTIVIAVAIAAITGACSTTREDAADYVDQGVQAVDRIARTHIAIARTDPTLDQAALATYAGQFEEDAAASAAQLAAVRKRIEDQENLLREIVQTMASSALEIVPGGRPLTDLAGAIGRGLRSADRSTSENIRATEERASARLERIDERVRAAHRAATEAKDAAKRAEDASSERVRAASDALSSEVKNTLAAYKEDLSTLKDKVGDKEAFEKELDDYLKSAGLSPAQVAEFKRTTNGLSEEEIVNLLVAIGAALGSGAAASRIGRSRSAKEIDTLSEETKSLRAKLDSLPPRAGNSAG